MSPPPPPCAPDATPRAAPPRRRASLVLAGCLALGALGLSGPAQPLLGMAGLALWPEVPALLAQLDLPAGLPAPPLALPAGRAMPPAGGPEAERYLSGLADAVAQGWGDPAALRRLMLARQSLPSLRGGVLRSLEAVRSLRPLGWGMVRVEIGPAQGPGGLGLDLAWQAGGWRVTRLELLDPAGGPA